MYICPAFSFSCSQLKCHSCLLACLFCQFPLINVEGESVCCNELKRVTKGEGENEYGNLLVVK